MANVASYYAHQTVARLNATAEDTQMINRIHAQLQHAILHGPAFEMPDRSSDRLATARAAAAKAQSMESGQLSSIPAIKAFILGGKAIFTIAGQSTRYTFKITRKDPDVGSSYTQAVFFISLLTGPDNTADYTYIGILDVDRGQIRLTRKSTYTPDSKPVQAFNWTARRIWAGQPIAPAVFYHVGRCGRCGRALTVPASIESGFGPECAGRLGE